VAGGTLWLIVAGRPMLLSVSWVAARAMVLPRFGHGEFLAAGRGVGHSPHFVALISPQVPQGCRMVVGTPRMPHLCGGEVVPGWRKRQDAKHIVVYPI